MTIEEVVLVDARGARIGRQPKSLVHHASTPLHLAFSCYLFDPDGRLLLTRRASTKRTWPGVWTNSCCGHPAPGEPIETAVLRRLRSELGLAEPDRLTLVLPRFRYRATMPDGVQENEICPVFLAVTTGVPDPDPEEVDAVEWVPWQPFAAEVLAGVRAVSPWCRLQLAELSALGPEPLAWPAAGAEDLPPAARPGRLP